jgi:hypothetical protein
LDNLTTDRLTIRPFEREDLSAVHRILNAAFGASDTEADVGSWLEWSRLNARWFPAMRQFPYGDRAVALAATGEVVAVAGYAPLLMPFLAHPRDDRIRQLRVAGRHAQGRHDPHPQSPARAGVDAGGRRALRVPTISGTTGVNDLMSQLRFLTAGESHGPKLTAILEGMVAGLPVNAPPSTGSWRGGRSRTARAGA